MSCFELEVIESLRELLEDGFSELVSTFVSDGERRLDLIRKALADKDLVTVSNEAHGIKGSSQNIGALPLADVASKIESQARDGNAAELEQDFASLLQLFAATVEELRSF